MYLLMCDSHMQKMLEVTQIRSGYLNGKKEKKKHLRPLYQNDF